MTGNSGNIRSGLAVVAMIVMIALGTAVTAFAGGGGVGTGGGGGGGDSSDETSGTGDRYQQTWDNFSSKDKTWARKTSQCEAGGDPDIHSPGKDYHGAFQFLKSTWQSAPMSKGSDPHVHNWKTQAVVAVKWMHKAGKGQWPVCGS